MSIPSWSSYPLPGLRALSFIGIEVHWAILQYVLGLPFMTFIALLIYLRTKNGKWKRIAKTLTKGFIILFAVGAATGTASEFGLVLLWPNLTEAAGRYIYFPLYAEIFAFMMEVIFIYLLWYGWNRFSDKALVAISFFAFLGAWYSAAMILSVNSFMQGPPGLKPAFVPGPHPKYLYSEGYPRLTVAVPLDILHLLNVTKLLSLGVNVVTHNGKPLTVGLTVSGVKTKALVITMPVSIVQELVREGFKGFLLKDSVLVKANLINSTEIKVLAKNPYELHRLITIINAYQYVPATYLEGTSTTLDPQQLGQVLLNIPVKNYLDPILMSTVKYFGYATITFKSPDYVPTLMHAIGSALVVSSFTAFAGFSLRLLRSKDLDEDYRDYLRKALVYTAVFAAIAIFYQGFISGHEMGVAVAHYNPEKFAAIEGTSAHFKSIAGVLHLHGITKLLAYGSMRYSLPNYDKIPPHYCQCKLTGYPSYDCRPPLMIDYTYYGMVFLGIIIGIYGLIVGLIALRDRSVLIDKLLGIFRINSYIWKEPLARKILSLSLFMAFLAQLSSTLGWVTREVGRKPWTIYGMMTVDVASSTNKVVHETGPLVAIALFYISLLLVLIITAYKILWKSSERR